MGKKTSKLLQKLTLQNGPTVKLITGNQIPHNKLNFNQQGFRHLPVKFNKRKRDKEKTISKIRSNSYHLKLPTVQRRSITNLILPNLSKKKKNKINGSQQIPKQKKQIPLHQSNKILPYNRSNGRNMTKPGVRDTK
jgi:hypothetical protein